MQVELSAGPFSYVDTGDGEEAILLLHAMRRSAGDWQPIIDRLSDSYRTIALDLRGHGGSSRTISYSFELMRDDVRDFADSLGLTRFHLIGHSMGATVSVLFAEHWPGRIDRLVLEDTPPPSGREQIPAPSAEAPEPVSFDWAVLGPIIHQLNNPDPAWWADLGKITAPTLVIGGGSDSFIDQRELSAMVSRIPHGRLVTIEAGHHVHSSKPDEFASAVQAFLTG
ncbi:MAG: alpha/beta hydrolase [Acidimicrobiia bacterium]